MEVGVAVEHGGITAITEEERRSLWVMGARLDIVVDGDQTGGAYAIAEDRSDPGFGPPPHVHEREDEVFYVIEGEYLFGGDDWEVRARSGTLVHAPRGQLHWWRNVGTGPGRHLEIFVPAGLEQMFLEIGTPITDDHPQPPPPDPGALLDTAPRYGVTFKLPES
jgi:mannose-6-phosphate isomerase-like protein (cupin superfamily)